MVDDELCAFHFVLRKALQTVFVVCLQNEVNAIKWDPSGMLLASCSDDMTLKVRLNDQQQVGTLRAVVSNSFLRHFLEPNRI